jgi:hypothetical protein
MVDVWHSAWLQHTMTPHDFLSLLWPETGFYALATPFRIPGTDVTTYAHKVFETVEDAVAFADRRKSTTDIFFCVHSLREPRVWNPDKVDRKTGQQGAYEVRTQANMLAAKCFFFDLDVGSDPKKYASQAEALADLRRFCSETKMPKPLISSSGGGLHVYWPIDEALPSSIWRQYAAQLKKLAVSHGLRADPMRTTDVSSVLRVAGTFNLKNLENPRKVRVLMEGAVTPATTFAAILSDALIRAGNTPKPIDEFSAAPDDDLGSNTDKVYDGPPVSMQALGKACGQVRRFARLRGNVSEPEWYAMLQLIRHVEDGEEWCHKLSAGHPSYDKDATDQKLLYLQSKDVGPTLCATLDDRCGGGVCAACPHFGAVKSPLVAGRSKDLAPAPVVAPTIPSAPVVQLPDPPEPFKRMKGGGIGVEITNREGNEVTVVIYDHDLYPIRRIIDRERRVEQQVWRAHLPRGVNHDFVIDASALYRADVLASQLANNGVYPRPSRIKEVQEYMSAYISQLQKLQDADNSYNTLGWHNEFQVFVLPDKVLHRNGTVTPAQLTSHAESSSQAISKAGTLARQVELLKFYNHPSYRPNQWTILCGLASVIFHMTGHAGVVANVTGEAGASKSTTLYTAASLWGHPMKFPLNGTNHGATQKARAQRLTTMGSLPVCVDEITTMGYKDAQELVMNITQPEGRVALMRDGKERRQSEGEKSTILISTANNSLHGLLSHENSAGTAGSMRVVEIRFVAGKTHAKSQADEYLQELRANHGHIGEIFVSYVLANYATVYARVREKMRQIDRDADIQSGERFWGAKAAAVIVACEIVKELGLLDYEAEALYRWFLNDLLPQMRGVITAEYNTPLTTLADYLETISGNMIVMGQSPSGSYVLRAPTGQLLAHYDTGHKVMMVLKKGFKDYCIRIGADATKILDELATFTTDGTGRTSRIITNKSVRKVMGAGTEYAKIQSSCFVVNMAHPDVTGVVDLSVVSGDPQATTPARGQVKAV